MARVYFDTNVFSNLRADKDERFHELNELLSIYKNKLSFYFSYAHIRDKRKDLTDFKFSDFDFMETLVGDNYLAYHPHEKITSFYLATPCMVFDDNPGDDLDGLLNFFDDGDDDDEIIKSFKGLTRTLYSAIPLPLPEATYDDLTDAQKNFIAEIIPFDKDQPTFFDLMNNMSSFTRKVFADSNLYKELRNMIYTGINNGTMTLDDDLDFNEALKKTVVQKTFIEFVKDNINVPDKSQIPYYNFYMSAYNMLDIFGISKDKITPKNTLNNLLTDAMHSYFARYCDYFITDDHTITVKSKALYKLFDVKTKVLSVDEFKQLLPELLCDFDEHWDWFSRKLIHDLQTAERLAPDVVGDHTIYRLASNHMYLDFFDAVLDIKGPIIDEIVFFKGESHYLSEAGYSEQAQIIERALTIFGDDLHNKGRFEYKIHPIKHPELMERIWHIGDLIIELKNHALINKYALVITMDKVKGKTTIFD